MSIYKNNNKLNSYIIILIALFILVLVTKDKFNILQEKLDLKETSNITLLEKRLELERLNNKKTELLNSSENIDKYLLEIKEDELVDYIYSYIEKTNDRTGVVIIKSISISEPKDTEI
jgi:predicted Holliday junction resolvase-like endonuclease